MTDWVIRLIDWGGYAGVFLLMLLETIFPPLPSEVILPVAGLRAANGPLSLEGVVAAGTAGSMTGNLIWYLAARRIGLERFRLFIDRHGRWLTMDWRDVERMQDMFARFGGGIVFTARVLPAVRTFVSIPAGFFHMSLVKYLVWSTVGTAIWSALFAAAGYGMGTRFGAIEYIVGPVASAIILAILAWYVWRQLTWDRRQARRADGRGDRRP